MFVFILINNGFQKLEVNFASRIEITVFVVLRSLKFFRINISAMFIDLRVDLTSIKCVSLLILSTTTIMESFCFLVLGKPAIKSIFIVSHFHFRIGIGCNNPIQCWLTPQPATIKAPGHIVFYFSFHVRPVKIFFQCLYKLLIPWMTYRRTII